MHYKEAEIMFEVMDVDVQINGSDCGLHTVATAYELCAGNDPTGITWEHHQLRSHLQQSSHFRGKVRDLRSGIVRASFRVPIFCICRMPEGQSANMARCIKCGEWYHKTCTNTVFFEEKRAMGLRTLQIDMDMTVVYANTYDESLLITIHDRTSKLKGRIT